jgi:hypothetical protein
LERQAFLTFKGNEMDSIKPVKIQAEIFWAKWMKELNTRFNSDNEKYECTLGNISEAGATALRELGITVKNKPDMGNYIVGKSKFIFEPVDNEGHPVNIDDIGNNTKVIALVSSYKHKMSAKFGNAPSIKKIIVTELKVYSPEARTEQPVEFDEAL